MKRLNRRLRHLLTDLLSYSLSALVFLFLYAPIAIVIIFSFNSSRRNIVFESWTFSWYGEMLANAPLLSSFANTLIVAALSAIISAIIGTFTGIAMSKYKFGTKNILDALLYIPVIIPEIILGISLLASFSLAYIPLGRISLVIAHTTFCIPFVVFTVRARLSDYDYSMEEAAMDLGANRLQVLTGITLPIINPGIISGTLLAFTLSIDDFIISFFTAGPQSPTFPLKIMESVRSGIRPDIYALSSIIMFITFIIAIISQSARYRKAKKSRKESC